MKHERDFMENGSRYYFDFGECSASNGFAQIDTHQDAAYFGMWTNPYDFVVVSYIEGDINRDTASNAEEYTAYLRKLHAAYEKMENPIRGIDPMLNDDLRDRFVELGLTDLLHESCRPKEATVDTTSPDGITSD